MDTSDRALSRAIKATKQQQRYLEILLNDCGFGERVQRNAYLSGELDRDIRFLDNLTLYESSKMIGLLKGMKGDYTSYPWEDEPDDEDDSKWNRRLK